jgi:branched-chain amino acid transport system substrate-binding protein
VGHLDPARPERALTCGLGFGASGCGFTGFADPAMVPMRAAPMPAPLRGRAATPTRHPMAPSRWRRRIALLALACVGFAAPAAAEVTIAIIGPWSANLSYAASGTLRGAELMVESLNAGGGLLGQRLRTVQIDDGCNPGQAEAAIKLAVANHPVAAMGGACAPGAIHISQLLAAAGILQLVPNVPQEELSEAGVATVFRMTGRSDHEGSFTAGHIARRWAGRRIAIADDGEPHWHEGAEAVAAGLARQGVPVALRTRFAPNRPSYAELVREVADKGIELLYLNGLPPDMGVIVREMAAAHLATEIVASRDVRIEVFRQAAGRSLEGVYFVDRRDWTDFALADPILAAEQARGGDVNVFLASAYVSLQIWSEGVAAANSFAAPAVAAAIKSRRFATALGTLAFEANGDLTPESEGWTFYRWHDGAAERLD